MARRREPFYSSEERRPWVNIDAQHNTVASGSLDGPYPALCFEIGDSLQEELMHPELIKSVLAQKRLAVALWQKQSGITLIEINHTPDRSLAIGYVHGSCPENDWCSVSRYSHHAWGASFIGTQENLDPRPIVQALRQLLEVPLGSPDLPEQELIADEAVQRIVIDFPEFIERRALPLDTSIGALALLATQEYADITRSGFATDRV